MNPKISIITITYNSEKTLRRAIDSIVSQEYDSLEYIIVDGGSADSTVEIVESYGNRISKWISEPDDGISSAFNKGINMATGDIIGIINSDDGLEPGALSAIAVAYDPKVDIYRGKVLLWKENTNTKAVEIPSMHFDYKGMNKISHQGTFVTKSAYKKYGVYDEKCKYAMDYDLLLRFEQAGAKFKYVNKVLAFYSLGGLTFSKVTKDRIKEIEYIMRKNGATNKDVLYYCCFRTVKLLVSKIIPKEILMKLRNPSH